MTAPLFLPDAAGVSDAAVGGFVELDGPEGRHAVSVRRLSIGEAVDIGDGQGTVLHARVAAVTGRDSLVAEVLAREVTPAPQPRLVVVQALPKGERAEQAVETLTEVGVDVIVPWQAHRCVVRWAGERADRSRARWVAAARSATKQARRSRLPMIAELAGGEEVEARIKGAARAVVLHEEGASPLRGIEWPTAGDVVLVVGPEGGISPEEVDRFTRAGAVVGRMGPTVMRASTAGTVGAAVVLSSTDRWS